MAPRARRFLRRRAECAPQMGRSASRVRVGPRTGRRLQVAGRLPRCLEGELNRSPSSVADSPSGDVAASRLRARHFRNVTPTTKTGGTGDAVSHAVLLDRLRAEARESALCRSSGGPAGSGSLSCNFRSGLWLREIVRGGDTRDAQYQGGHERLHLSRLLRLNCARATMPAVVSGWLRL